MEIWDAYCKAGMKQGFDLVRGEPIPSGCYHLVSEVVILNQDRKYLAVQRDLTKSYPGLYEISAGGSVLKEETSKEGAVREVKEETGIHIQVLQLKYKAISEEHQTIYHCYLAHVDVAEDSIQLQPGETMGYTWVEKDCIETFLKSGQHVKGRHERVWRVIE